MALPTLESAQKVELEPTHKWVRAYLNGRVVADSHAAKIVRPEGKWPNTYAFPPEDVKGPVPEGIRVDVDGHIALKWDKIDHWYEEAEEVFVHPRDPHVRIDTLRSSREVVVELEDELLARSTRPTLLFEDVPNLPIRYYLPHEDVEMAKLRSNKEKTSTCPYKGWASYYDVKIGGKWQEALAWTYRAPLREVEPIRGLIAFYSEKVDMTVDGVPEKRPGS